MLTLFGVTSNGMSSSLTGYLVASRPTPKQAIVAARPTPEGLANAPSGRVTGVFIIGTRRSAAKKRRLALVSRVLTASSAVRARLVFARITTAVKLVILSLRHIAVHLRRGWQRIVVSAEVQYDAVL